MGASEALLLAVHVTFTYVTIVAVDDVMIETRYGTLVGNRKVYQYGLYGKYYVPSIHIYIYIYMYIFLLLISMLWHRQAIFKSKGDKLCSSAESRIWTRDPRHQIASRLNARWQTDWAIEDQAKTRPRCNSFLLATHICVFELGRFR